MERVMKRITPKTIPGCSVSKFDYLPSHVDLSSHIASFHKQVIEGVENNRLKQIRKRLHKMGHQFSDVSTLKQFLIENATVVTNSEKPDYREMYLFAGTKDQVTVGSWWETFEYVHNFDAPERGFSMTIIAGMPPGSYQPNCPSRSCSSFQSSESESE
jgi:hypothetical protein